MCSVAKIHEKAVYTKARQHFKLRDGHRHRASDKVLTAGRTDGGHILPGALGDRLRISGIDGLLADQIPGPSW
jgi:hypothetical protein